MAVTRNVLFLQGPPSSFWTELARDFEAAGHKTFKINVSSADWLFWRKPGAINFRGRIEQWGEWVTKFMRDNAITDVVYYADQQIYHRVAARAAREINVAAIAIEFGYLRPDWLTIERNGMGVYSHFPNDPLIISRIGRDAPEPDLKVRYPYSFGAEAVGEIVYNLSNVFLRPFFPFYNSERYVHPIAEYISWLPRVWRQWRDRESNRRISAECNAGDPAFFMLAMQLQSDYQIRRNSHYGHLSAMIDEVVGSFAAHAPSDYRLVVKLHPLDNGGENWQRVIADAARSHNVSGRVVTIDGGDLGVMLTRARGCVLVNSTVGLHAIRARCPTKVLGIAVFDIPGLTHQGTLNEFWRAPEPVDPELADDFVRALALTIQVKGSFYDKSGRGAARSEIVRRITAGAVNEPGAFVTPPPRIERARQLGVPLEG